MSIPALPLVLDLSTVTATRNGGAFRAEPYLLTVFFKVDGSTVRIAPRADGKLVLQGNPLVRRTDSRHDNLPKVKDGETVAVPDAVGRFAPVLDLIRLPAALRSTLVGGISGVVGCVSVLLEQDLVGDGPAEAGHEAFTGEVARVLDEIIPTLGVGRATPGPADLAALGDRIGAAVRAAVLDEGNILQDLFAGLDPDDVVGFAVVLSTHAGLLDDPQQPITMTFTGAGVYEAVGSVAAVPG